VAALDVGKNVPDHLADRDLVSWVYDTYPFNLTGQPAATVCAGFSHGMPVACSSSAARSANTTWCAPPRRSSNRYCGRSDASLGQIR
jgi:hypothetical protein